MTNDGKIKRLEDLKFVEEVIPQDNNDFSIRICGTSFELPFSCNKNSENEWEVEPKFSVYSHKGFYPGKIGTHTILEDAKITSVKLTLFGFDETVAKYFFFKSVEPLFGKETIYNSEGKEVTEEEVREKLRESKS